jgi:hypothetical protein
MKLLNAFIGALSISLAGVIITAPPVRSRLKTPVIRDVVAGLLAATFAVVGFLIKSLVFDAR